MMLHGAVLFAVNADRGLVSLEMLVSKLMLPVKWLVAAVSRIHAVELDDDDDDDVVCIACDTIDDDGNVDDNESDAMIMNDV